MKKGYENEEEVIRTFLTMSKNQKIEHFDFLEGFSTLHYTLYEKLNGHGLLSFDDFFELESEILSPDDLEQYTIETPYIVITKYDILEGIIRKRYECFRETFIDNPVLQELHVLYNKIQNMFKNNQLEDIPLKEKIIVFDELIHAQHVTGNLFDDVDIESIKNEIDSE